jgi:hypothetical protein
MKVLTQCAFLFCLVIGAVFGLLLWRAINPPRARSRAVDCALGTMCLVIIMAAVLPNFAAARWTDCFRGACLANLKQIQGAKETWALEFKKAVTEIPKSADLFGETNYIKIEPTCPAGGIYRLRAVRENPVCSIGGRDHSLDQPPKEYEKPSIVVPATLGVATGTLVGVASAMGLQPLWRRHWGTCAISGASR